MPAMKLSELKGKVAIEVVRDGEFESLGLVTHNSPRQLVFIEDVMYIPRLLEKNNVTCAITTRDIVSLIPRQKSLAISETPRKSFFDIHNYLALSTDFYGKPFNTEIASTAKTHPTAYIAPQNVRIGEGCEIGPNVSILEGTVLEDDVIIRAGVVMGTEGFEFERIGEEIIPVNHAGGVIVHKRVEIQANCCISKAVFGGHY